MNNQTDTFTNGWNINQKKTVDIKETLIKLFRSSGKGCENQNMNSWTDTRVNDQALEMRRSRFAALLWGKC